MNEKAPNPENTHETPVKTSEWDSLAETAPTPDWDSVQEVEFSPEAARRRKSAFEKSRDRQVDLLAEYIRENGAINTFDLYPKRPKTMDKIKSIIYSSKIGQKLFPGKALDLAKEDLDVADRANSIIDEEDEQRREAERQQKAEERARRETEEAERRRVAEEERLTKQMADGHEYSMYEKRNWFKNQRAQELLERQFNAEFTSIDELEILADAGEDKLSVDHREYEGKDIKIITSKGYPLKFLQTAIDFKLTNGQVVESRIGSKTAQNLIDNPSLWVRNGHDLQVGGNSSTSEADTISTSYIDSDYGIGGPGGAESPAGLTYLFSHLDGDSIIVMTTSDQGTNNSNGTHRTGINEYSLTPEELAKETKIHNEVQIRRYDETGKPKRPDALVTYDGKITEAALRHAAFFGVPVVNIERAPYVKQMRERAAKMIEDYQGSESYEDLSGFLDDVATLMPTHTLPHISWIGDNPAHKNQAQGIEWNIPHGMSPEAREKLIKILTDEEPRLKMDFLKQSLDKGLSQVEQQEGKIKYMDNISSVARNTNISTGEQENCIRLNIKVESGGRSHYEDLFITESDKEYGDISGKIDKFRELGGSVDDRRLQPDRE